jgi:hypothetical protein
MSRIHPRAITIRPSRVRAIFQGDTRGEPTEWRTFVLLPTEASLHIDGAGDRRVAWSGGGLGMIHRVEFLRAESRCFDALTFSSPYRMAASIAWRNCDAVRVAAFSPSGTLLGRSQPVTLRRSFAPPIVLVAQREPLDVIDRLPVAALASAGALDEWTFSVSGDQAPSAPAATNPPTYVIQPSGTRGVQRARPADDQVTGSLSLSAQGAGDDVHLRALRFRTEGFAHRRSGSRKRDTASTAAASGHTTACAACGCKQRREGGECDAIT